MISNGIYLCPHVVLSKPCSGVGYSLGILSQLQSRTWDDRDLMIFFGVPLGSEPAGILGINPREMKTNLHTKTITQMFRAALFVTAKKVEPTQMSIN